MKTPLRNKGISFRTGYRSFLFCICISALFPIHAFSQDISIVSDTEWLLRGDPVNLSYRSTLIGGGHYDVLDSYLTPGIASQYKGWGIKVLNDQMKMRNFWNGRVSSQQLINVDFSSTKNTPETASDYSVFLDYSYGLHYHFRPLPNLKLLAGSQVNGNLGAIYNTRNGNNPVSAKFGINLTLSGMADYRFRIKEQPIAVRYQMDIPFIGGLFSPHYGQSYYEISLGNHDGLFHFASFHNQFIMKNYVTVEIPLKSFTLRMTYLNSIYDTDVSQLQTNITSNTFMIGFVKEFFSFPGRKGGIERAYKYRVYNRVFD